MKKMLSSFIVMSLICCSVAYGASPSGADAAAQEINYIESQAAPQRAEKTFLAKTENISQVVETKKVETSAVAKPEIKQLSAKELKEELKEYGSFIGGPGMSARDYEKSMSYEWTQWSTKKAYKKQTVDIAKSYTYEDLQEFMLNWTALEGVSVYEIGWSVRGRDIFMVDINKTTVANPKTVVLTGNVHARETAGSVFIIKQLNDLLNDKNAEEYLSKVRILAVPCVNPDGRDGVAFDTKNFTYSNGLLWKANARGVDINRNFPGLSWGQIKKGNNKVSLWSDTHEKMYFPGYSAGSEPETKALMKFLQYAIVDEQADILIDYHQQGRIQYAGKPWQTEEQQKRCSDLASVLSKFMANNNSYARVPEEISYGLRGEGSTLTDYACSLAVGAKFSEKYGFMVYTDGENEYPLITGVRAGEEANPKFATTTLEIGSGSAYLGYSEKTRKNLATEYKAYHFDELLYTVFDYVIGDEVFEPKMSLKNFPVMDQDEYPTGCESVSSVMLLTSMGYDITVDEFIDEYLNKISSTDKFYKKKSNQKKNVYNYYFVGNPRKSSGKACNAPVIVEAITQFFDETNAKNNEVVNLTGKSFGSVAKIANSGKPVLLWVSGELTGPTRSYDLYGFTIRTNRHCVVLLQADKEAGEVVVADPMIGELRTWAYDDVVTQYNLYGKQAVYVK